MSGSKLYEDLTSVSGYDSVEQAISADDGRPRLLLLGAKHCGKTSIQKVVFQKVSPHETLFLDPTASIDVRDISNNVYVQLKVIDFPGEYDFTDKKVTPEAVFSKDGAVVFVIDAQDDAQDDVAAIEYFLEVAKLAHSVNPKLAFEVLIHKVESQSDAFFDEPKNEYVRHIRQQILEQLREEKIDVHPVFHLTSIYDHTVFEAFSKIVQKRIPHVSSLEGLLSGLVNSCRIEKAYIFDIISKIYLATDSSDLDHFYELCSDAIDVVIDVSCIYSEQKVKNRSRSADQGGSGGSASASAAPSQSDAKGQSDGGAAGSPTTADTKASGGTDLKSAKGSGGSGLPYDSNSAAVIHMENNYVLYLREVDTYLALVCLMRQDAYTNTGLLEYNFSCFKKAIQELKVRYPPVGSARLGSMDNSISAYSNATSRAGTQVRTGRGASGASQGGGIGAPFLGREGAPATVTSTTTTRDTRGVAE